MSRFDNRKIGRNDSPIYTELLKDRGVKSIRHFDTPKIKYPSEKEIQKLNIVSVLWKGGERYSKLAHKYYGDVNKWYLIAWFNKKPTDFHVELGETIYIPFPLERVLFLYGR